HVPRTIHDPHEGILVYLAASIFGSLLRFAQKMLCEIIFQNKICHLHAAQKNNKSHLKILEFSDNIVLCIP
ncbi:MAG: hypothetical protein LBK83_09805, partial [Treponema sp.]|nr:hypothetical protein [Treponema sp.]